jgi:hypothetical protein
MTGGLLILSPIEKSVGATPTLNLGKPAQGLIQPDGTFTMSTYGTDDGAVIGPHKVVLNLAVLEDENNPQPCTKAPKDLVVEVVEGENFLEIDLGKKKR